MHFSISIVRVSDVVQSSAAWKFVGNLGQNLQPQIVVGFSCKTGSCNKIFMFTSAKTRMTEYCMFYFMVNCIYHVFSPKPWLNRVAHRGRAPVSVKIGLPYSGFNI